MEIKKKNIVVIKKYIENYLKKTLKICCFPFFFISELGKLYFLNPKETFKISKIALK